MGANAAQRSSAGPSILVDRAVMDALRRAVGDDVFLDIFNDAQFELAERLARLRELIADGDLERASRLAHDIVSVAGSIGLSALSDLAAALERGCERGDQAAAGALADRLARVGAASLAQAAALGGGLMPKPAQR